MQERQLQDQAVTLASQAQQIEIKDAASAQAATDFLGGVATLEKAIQEFFKPMKTDAHRAWKTVCERETEQLAPVQEARSIAKGKLKDWTNAEEKRIAEENRKREEERKREEDRRKKELEDKAKKAEAKGNTERADELRQQAAETFVPPTEIKPETPRTAYATNGGKTTTRKVTVVQITDPGAVMRAVIAGTFPTAIIEIKEGALKRWFDANGIKTYNENGVRVYQENDINVHAAR